MPIAILMIAPTAASSRESTPGPDVDTPPLEPDLTDTPVPPADPGVALPRAFRVEGVRVFTKDNQGRRVYFIPPGQTRSKWPTSARWASDWWDGQCNSGESQYSILKYYVRPNRHPRMDGDQAKMYCGKFDRYDREPYTEAAFGLRHIRPNHRDAFAELASWQGSTWGNWMHWSIGRTLEYPVYRTVQSDTRYCYEGRFTFVAPNGSQTVRKVIVILGETGVRIMTAFPRSNTDYCDGTRF